MRTVPKTVDILGVRYRVKLVWTPVDPISLESCDAYCDFTKKEIVISRKLIPPERKQDFYHECFHAVLWEAGVSRNWTQGQSDRFEEPIVDCLAKWIARQK